MSQKFRLPCSCGEKIVIERRQAGSNVPCVCGKSVEVPTIREIDRLERVEEVEAPLPPIWGLRQGFAFLGLLIAIPAFIMAGYWYNEIPVLNETNVEQWASELSPADTWMMWKMYEHGMPKQPNAHTEAVKKNMDALRLKINVALLVGVAAVGVVAAALLMPKAKPARAP